MRDIQRYNTTIYTLDIGDSIDNLERDAGDDQDNVLNTLIKGNYVFIIHSCYM